MVWAQEPPWSLKAQAQKSGCYRTDPAGAVNDRLLPNGPPLCSGGRPPHTRFTLPAARERRLSEAEIGEKERDYLF